MPGEVSGVSGPLPQLIDAKGLQAELGVTRAAAEKIMQALPIVQLPQLRKVYVRRADVERLLEACTFAKDQVPALRAGAREEKCHPPLPRLRPEA
jgi:hypothetical protein